MARTTQPNRTVWITSPAKAHSVTANGSFCRIAARLTPRRPYGPRRVSPSTTRLKPLLHRSTDDLWSGDAAHLDDDPSAVLDAHDSSGSNLVREGMRLERLVIVFAKDEFAIKGGHDSRSSLERKPCEALNCRSKRMRWRPGASPRCPTKTRQTRRAVEPWNRSYPKTRQLSATVRPDEASCCARPRISLPGGEGRGQPHECRSVPLRDTCPMRARGVELSLRASRARLTESIGR
jgi:hypothetical protein